MQVLGCSGRLLTGCLASFFGCKCVGMQSLKCYGAFQCVTRF